MVNSGYKRSIPDEFKALPRLSGRAEVKMSFKRPGTEPFNVDG